MVIIRVFFLLIISTAVSWATSFDCMKASTQSERLICSDPYLGGLDEELAAAYRKAYKETDDRSKLKTEQVAWLKFRDTCETSLCIKELYETRIREIRNTKQEFLWIKEYVGKTTNQLAWDTRFSKLVESISPKSKDDFGFGEGGLAGKLSETLGGPPNKVRLIDDRYITLSACTFRFCPEKGFVWIDLEELLAIAAIVHYDTRKHNREKDPIIFIISKQVDVATVPGRFKVELNEWLIEEGVPINLVKLFINVEGDVIEFMDQ